LKIEFQVRSIDAYDLNMGKNDNKGLASKDLFKRDLFWAGIFEK